MVQLNLHLPEELKGKADQRAVEAGYSTTEAYIESLVRLDTEGVDYGAPEHLTFNSRSEFEAKVREGLKSPAREITDAYWDSRLHRLQGGK